jgi:hypothetical protein
LIKNKILFYLSFCASCLAGGPFASVAVAVVVIVSTGPALALTAALSGLLSGPVGRAHAPEDQIVPVHVWWTDVFRFWASAVLTFAHTQTDDALEVVSVPIAADDGFGAVPVLALMQESLAGLVRVLPVLVVCCRIVEQTSEVQSAACGANRR